MPAQKSKLYSCLFLSVLSCLASCDGGKEANNTTNGRQSGIPFACDADNGGLTLPQGFCAAIVADSLGFIRHLAVNGNGDLYVAMRNVRLGLGGILALRDTDGDGRMERIEKFSDTPGMNVAIRDEYLYFASDTDIYRYRLPAGQLLPEAPPEIIVRDLPPQVLHAGKTFAIGATDWLYVNVGAVSNACEQELEAPAAPGPDPCPELMQHAAIWRFSLDRVNQTQDQGGFRYAGGIRNAYAIDWHPVYRRLYVVQHGRDRLHELWPALYSAEDGARLPAEELMQVEEGGEYGWPYCYYDQIQHKRVLAPEYGGDGKQIGRCENYPPPLIGFPAHYGPNDMKFYTADQFPTRYRNGAFVAFHGSYNRGEFEQAGYQVVFVPFSAGRPAGDWEVFADGFAGTDPVIVPEDADHRPTGLAIGPDGSLYIADSVQGRIWRVIYTGGPE